MADPIISAQVPAAVITAIDDAAFAIEIELGRKVSRSEAVRRLLMSSLHMQECPPVRTRTRPRPAVRSRVKPVAAGAAA